MTTLTALETLLGLRDGAAPGSGEYSAYSVAIDLFEQLDNLNSVAWQLLKALDAADAAGSPNAPPGYRASYLQGLEEARRIVLQTRIDDE